MTKQNTDPQAFLASLAEEEKMLVELRDELYDGSWESMLRDLNDRLKGRPYIYKLVNRIQDDIARIKKLRTFEKQNHVNLSDYGR